MQKIKNLDNIKSVQEFKNSYAQGHLLLITNNEGLCTLARKKDFSLIYPNLWFMNWKRCYFDNTLYIVTRGDGLSTLIKECDGSFVYENLWFKEWNEFDYELYEVTRQDGLSTLIYINDGSFVNENFWAYSWHDFGDKILARFKEDNLYRFIDKEDFSIINETISFSEIHLINSNFFELRINGSSEYMLARILNLEKTMMYTLKADIRYNGKYELCYDFKFTGEPRFLGLNGPYYELKRKDDLSVIITYDKYGINDSYNDDPKYLELFDNNIYLVTNIHSQLRTLIYIDTKTFVYDNKWFKNWEHFSKNFYKVTRSDGMCTLIRKEDASFVFPNIWFKKCEIFNEELYKVTRSDGMYTFIRYEDNSYLLPDRWFSDNKNDEIKEEQNDNSKEEEKEDTKQDVKTTKKEKLKWYEKLMKLLRLK